MKKAKNKTAHAIKSIAERMAKHGVWVRHQLGECISQKSLKSSISRRNDFEYFYHL